MARLLKGFTYLQHFSLQYHLQKRSNSSSDLVSITQLHYYNDTNIVHSVVHHVSGIAMIGLQCTVWLTMYLTSQPQMMASLWSCSLLSLLQKKNHSSSVTYLQHISLQYHLQKRSNSSSDLVPITQLEYCNDTNTVHSVVHQVSDRFATEYCLSLQRFLIISPVGKEPQQFSHWFNHQVCCVNLTNICLHNSSLSIKLVGEDMVSLRHGSLRDHISVAHFFAISPVEKEQQLLQTLFQ